MEFKILVILFCFIGFIQFIFAEEPVPTTYSQEGDNVIFDGKWSFTREWKESSLNTWKLNDGTQMVLRTFHDGNFIYVFIDYLSDITEDKGLDKSTVCFGKPEDHEIANENDFCFIVVSGKNNPIVLQGGSPIAMNGNFERISNEKFIGVGRMSDKADRYTAIPHESYEFKIPIDLIGRNYEYSFYLAVYDYHKGISQSWPRDIILENNFSIPSPNYWGLFYSPDKSIPEFSTPFILLTMIFFIMIITMRSIWKSPIN